MIERSLFAPKRADDGRAKQSRLGRLAFATWRCRCLIELRSAARSADQALAPWQFHSGYLEGVCAAGLLAPLLDASCEPASWKTGYDFWRAHPLLHRRIAIPGIETPPLRVPRLGASLRIAARRSEVTP